MANLRKAEELNNRLKSISNKYRGSIINVSMLDNNVTAIKDLVQKSYECGVISLYRPVTGQEKQELQKNEKDEIAGAYCASLDGKKYYITYKPQTGKSRNAGSRLEHVNRSTPFVEALITKLSVQYSFLYCKSKVDESMLKLGEVTTGDGFKASDKTIRQEGVSAKYELFFLLECRDTIGASESLSTIIDSVLLDVDSLNGDFFSAMTYVQQDRTNIVGEGEAPAVSPEISNQLNRIITSVREQSEVRSRIIDFLAKSENSSVHKYFAKRNEAFLSLTGGAPVNVLNSTVECRLMPISVFLNELENYSVTYQITEKSGISTPFSFTVNPFKRDNKILCPCCGSEINSVHKIVVGWDGKERKILCTNCATTCGHKKCTEWVKKEQVCEVCGKPCCSEHSGTCKDGERICKSCSTIMRTRSGESVSPKKMAVPGKAEFYVYNKVMQALSSGLKGNSVKKAFGSEKLYHKSECVLCATPEGEPKYYLSADTKTCAVCGKPFYKKHLKPTKDGKIVCFDHVYNCKCGAVVSTQDTFFCAESGCEEKFCRFCKPIKTPIKPNFRKAYQLKKSNEAKGVVRGLFDVGNKNYVCARHVEICKICGALKPLSKLKKCNDCGGYFCYDCSDGQLCPTCAKSKLAQSTNYKAISGKVRAKHLRKNFKISARLFDKIAVFGDHVHVITINTRKNNQKTIYNKQKQIFTYTQDGESLKTKKAREILEKSQ